MIKIDLEMDNYTTQENKVLLIDLGVFQFTYYSLERLRFIGEIHVTKYFMNTLKVVLIT